MKRSGHRNTSFSCDANEVHKVSAETEFIAILGTTLIEEKFLSMDYVTDIYVQSLRPHGFERSIYTKDFKAVIMKNMADQVEFSKPDFNIPEKICSSQSKSVAVKDAAKTKASNNKMLNVIYCALAIRWDILEPDKWTFQRSFDIDGQKKMFPLHCKS